ncbi:hypothetical protein SK128_007325, partial [Halocaridina rubra]
MADKSPGKPPPTGGGVDDRGRTEKRRRALLNRVNFFEQVWWGRTRSPSLEERTRSPSGGIRERPPSSQGARSPSVERATEAFEADFPNPQEGEEGPGKEKRRRRESDSSEGLAEDSYTRQRTPPGQHDDDWEWVEETSTLAEDIERRLEERRRMRSGSTTPTMEWVHLRRTGERDRRSPSEGKVPTPEPWESSAYSPRENSSMAEEIERRLDQHRQEVKQRLSSPVKDWPQLRRSPAPGSSRGGTPDRDADATFTSRSRTTSGDRRKSRESSLSPGRQVVTREVVAKAERRGGLATAVTTKTHSTTVWDTSDGVPHTKTHSTSDNLEEEDPGTLGRDDYQRVEEEERESIERGERKKYNRVVVRRTVERTVTSSPSPEPLAQRILSPRARSLSPENSSLPSHKTRSRTRSGPKSRLRSRTPSVERILEVEEAEEATISLASSKDPFDKDDIQASGATSLSPDHTEETSTAKGIHTSASDAKKSPGSKITMEAVSTVQWKDGGTKNEVRRYSTRVLIKDRDPSYTKYVISSRTTSKDSLFSTASSSEDSPSWDGAPSWMNRATPTEVDEVDADVGTFRERSKEYQQHISTLK